MASFGVPCFQACGCRTHDLAHELTLENQYLRSVIDGIHKELQATRERASGAEARVRELQVRLIQLDGERRSACSDHPDTDEYDVVDDAESSDDMP
jgi:phage shock protein A